MGLPLEPVPRINVVVVSETLLTAGDEDAVDDVSVGKAVVPLVLRDGAVNQELLSVVLGLTPCPSELERDDGTEPDTEARDDDEVIVEKEPVSVLLESAPDGPKPKVKGGGLVSVAVDDVVLAEVTFGEGPPPVPDGRTFELVPVAFVGGFQPVQPVKVVLLLAQGGRVEFPPKLDESGVGNTVTVIFGQDVEAEVVLTLPVADKSVAVVFEDPVVV